MALSEFDIIERYFAPCGPQTMEEKQTKGVVIGVGDDCAVLNLQPGQQLAISMDTLVADVHFPADAEPNLIAHRALAVNLSDLAAMGAEPRWFTLSITLPDNDLQWLNQFSSSLKNLAQQYQCFLVGGDTTKGPLSITIQVHGQVPEGQAITRSGAKVGDNIYVTGFLGDAGAGLAVVQNKLKPSIDVQHYLMQRYYKPEARVDVGMALRGIASAAIDISDGLGTDLGKLVKSSKIGAVIESSKVPISISLSAVKNTAQALQLALSAGDDYELCFTVPQAKVKQLHESLSLLDVPYTKIGAVVEGEGVLCVDTQGNELRIEQQGYYHF